MAEWKNDGYRVFGDSWRNMVSRIALDQQFRVIALDTHEPAAGYATLIRLLTYLDEVAPGVEGDQGD